MVMKLLALTLCLLARLSLTLVLGSNIYFLFLKSQFSEEN